MILNNLVKNYIKNNKKQKNMIYKYYMKSLNKELINIWQKLDNKL